MELTWPPGTEIRMDRLASGRWAGTLKIHTDHSGDRWRMFRTECADPKAVVNSLQMKYRAALQKEPGLFRLQSSEAPGAK